MHRHLSLLALFVLARLLFSGHSLTASFRDSSAPEVAAQLSETSHMVSSLRPRLAESVRSDVFVQRYEFLPNKNERAAGGPTVYFLSAAFASVSIAWELARSRGTGDPARAGCRVTATRQMSRDVRKKMQNCHANVVTVPSTHGGLCTRSSATFKRGP